MREGSKCNVWTEKNGITMCSQQDHQPMAGTFRLPVMRTAEDLHMGETRKVGLTLWICLLDRTYLNLNPPGTRACPSI